MFHGQGRIVPVTLATSFRSGTARHREQDALYIYIYIYERVTMEPIEAYRGSILPGWYLASSPSTLPHNPRRASSSDIQQMQCEIARVSVVSLLANTT